MKKRKPLTNAEGEVRELTAEDFRHFKPLDHFPELAKLVRGQGERGPQKEPSASRGETDGCWWSKFWMMLAP